MIVAEANDPLTQLPVVSKDGVVRRPFVIADRNVDVRRRLELEAALGQTGRAGLIVALEVADDEAVKEAVQRGLGFGLLPETLLERELEQGTLREVIVEGVSLVEDVCLVRREQSVLSPAATALYVAILNANRPE